MTMLGCLLLDVASSGRSARGRSGGSVNGFISLGSLFLMPRFFLIALTRTLMTVGSTQCARVEKREWKPGWRTSLAQHSAVAGLGTSVTGIDVDKRLVASNDEDSKSTNTSTLPHLGKQLRGDSGNSHGVEKRHYPLSAASFSCSAHARIERIILASTKPILASGQWREAPATKTPSPVVRRYAAERRVQEANKRKCDSAIIS